MKLTLATVASSLLISTAAFAEIESTGQSLETSINEDIQSAVTAISDNNFRSASIYLETAAGNASRLELQRIYQSVAARAPLFEAENARFVLADSATLSFENILNNRGTYESIHKNENGDIVTVRIFGEDRDLKEFTSISTDDEMIRKASLEVVEMAGSPAIKRRIGEDGLYVLMMMEDEHALVEIVGEKEGGDMAFIEEFESSKN